MGLMGLCIEGMLFNCVNEFHGFIEGMLFYCANQFDSFYRGHAFLLKQ